MSHRRISPPSFSSASCNEVRRAQTSPTFLRHSEDRQSIRDDFFKPDRQATGVSRVSLDDLGPQVANHYLQDFDFKGFFSVFVGYGLVKPDLNRVATDVAAVVRTPLERLEKEGKKREGLAVSPFADQRINFGLSGSYLSFIFQRSEERHIPICWFDEEQNVDRRDIF
jgi:hypothetical protein